MRLFVDATFVMQPIELFWQHHNRRELSVNYGGKRVKRKKCSTHLFIESSLN